MLGILRIALRRPYTFVVLALLILIIGPLAALRTPTDIFPDIRIPVISVVFQYTGLPPDPMSGRIVTPFQRALTTTVNNIEHIEATSYTGFGVIKIFFQPTVDINTANAQVTAIAQTLLRFMPPGVTPPLILNYNASTVSIIQFALSGQGMSEQTLTDLAVLAHELRNPLTLIEGAAEILNAHPRDRGGIKQAQALIRRQLKWILRLVEDLEDVTRIATGKLEMRTERVDLTSVVQQAVDSSRLLILAGRHTLLVQVPACTMYVNADPMRLTQVLMNLIENSTKFCRKHGRIGICVERSADDAILRVQDDGIGIAADALPHVFDLFTKSGPATAGSRRGFGIGLNLVKRIVELHGGTVSARSDGPGAGSEFIVRIPAGSSRSR